jgi:hypothetical protein
MVTDYRSRLDVGDVDDPGVPLFGPSVPLSGTISYIGLSNERQLRYPFGRTLGGLTEASCYGIGTDAMALSG